MKKIDICENCGKDGELTYCFEFNSDLCDDCQDILYEALLYE